MSPAFPASLSEGEMAKTTRILAAGLVTLGLGSLHGTAEAQNLRLTVRVRNNARAPEPIVVAAQQRVAHIYADAGIDILWVTSGARITVALISRDQADLMHQVTDVMGYAPASGAEGGRLAYVLNHRVDEVSASYRFAKSIVLGAALAHEIGHLLLPSNPHSSTGLMRKKWAQPDLWDAGRGKLLFTPEQARAMRGRLEIER